MSQVERALVQVEKLLEARAEARRLASRRSRLQPELGRARQQVARREQVLAEEHADVERLERVSLSRILAGLSGSLTDRVTRERAEREEAAYRLRDARTALARVASEADQLEGDRARLGDVETAYQESLSDLLLTVRVSDHDRAAQIEAEAERRLAAIERRREVEEAIAAAHEALPRLREARRRCARAAEWATADLIGGLGLLDDLVKYDHLDAAVAEVSAAGAALGRLSRELADVELPGLRAPVTDGLDRGIDVWFDNLFTDHLVRRRIQEAARDLDRAIGEVEQTLARLAALRAELADA